MKATNSRKKITIEVDGEKITASKGFFLNYAFLLYGMSDGEMKKGHKAFANSLNEKATKVYNKLKDSGYFDDVM